MYLLLICQTNRLFAANYTAQFEPAHVTSGSTRKRPTLNFRDVEQTSIVIGRRSTSLHSQRDTNILALPVGGGVWCHYETLVLFGPRVWAGATSWYHDRLTPWYLADGTWNVIILKQWGYKTWATTLVFDAVDVGTRLPATLCILRELRVYMQTKMVGARTVTAWITSCSDT